jgi:hypothetical protein
VLFATDGPYANVTVARNVLAGGSRALVGGQAPGSHDIRVLDNKFSRMYYPTCGSDGPVSAFDAAEPGNQWSGNVWADTGLPIDP